MDLLETPLRLKEEELWSASNGAGVEGISLSGGAGVKGFSNGTASVGVEGSGDTYDFNAIGNGLNYAATSSKRWKKNISQIDSPLEKLLRLRGVYFDWDSAHVGKHDIGCIAEEVGAVIPEIVAYDENGIDAEGMDYSKLTPLLIEAIKEQQSQIQNLLNRIEILEHEK